MIKRRAAALIAASAILFAACSSAATTAPSAAAPASQAAPSAAASQAAASQAPASGTPVEGGTLVFGAAADPATLDSILIQDGESFRIAQQIYETLVKLKPGSSKDLEPGLASSWDVSSDGLTYTFHLQQGVTFHDGTPFNADAVVYNVNRWKNLPKALQGLDYYDGTVFGGYGADSNIDSVTKVDDSTVAVKLKTARSDFLSAMTLVPFGIQSPTALQKYNADSGSPDYWRSHPTGTGPYMFTGDFVAGDHYTVVKNPNYWDKANAGHLDKIIFKAISDPTQRLTALKSGTVDVTDYIDPNQWSQISSDPTLQLIKRDPLAVGRFGMNQTHKPFNDVKVRDAVAYAIDRDALVKTFFPNGAGQAADSDLLPGLVGYQPGAFGPNFSYDPAKAKQLLQESSCGVPCKIDVWYPDNVSRAYMPDPKGEFEAVRQMLEAVGFQVNPNHKDWHGGYLTDEANGTYPAWFIGWTYDYADPADGPGIFYAQKTGTCGGKNYTTAHNCEQGEDNPAVGAALAKAVAATDPTQREQLWQQAMALIGADMPIVPLVWAGSALGATAAVHNYIPSPTQSEYFNLIWKTATQ